MFGNNARKLPMDGDGSRLSVHAVFPTVQGEGPHTGQPSVFVRLAGCNLACSFCDTDFEAETVFSLAKLTAEIDRLAEDCGRRLVVITGGEPLRQPIGPFCEVLIARGYAVQIETNGTLFRQLPEQVDIVCSPKAQGRRYLGVHSALWPRVSALKFLISSRSHPYTGIPDLGQPGAIPIYLQPMDVLDAEENIANLEHAMVLAERHGCRMSLQTHKLLPID